VSYTLWKARPSGLTSWRRKIAREWIALAEAPSLRVVMIAVSAFVVLSSIYLRSARLVAAEDWSVCVFDVWNSISALRITDMRIPCLKIVGLGSIALI
jgi:hypothetical protein